MPTLVTQADTEVETRIRERIAVAYPDHGVLGEEFGSAGRRRRNAMDRGSD